MYSKKKRGMDNQNKEIDLIEVFNLIQTKIYKNKFLFVSIVIVFVILGFLYNSSKKETYTLSVYATSSINRIVLDNFINDINIKNSEEKKIIPKLEKVSISYDESNDNNVFGVEIVFNDTSNYKNTILQICKVIDDIRYVKSQIDSRKVNIELKIDNYLEEIEKIKKIQDLIFNKNNSQTTIISTNGLSKDKINFLNQIIDLKNKLHKIVSIKILDDDFNIIQENNSTVIRIIKFLILGSFIALIIVVLKK